MAVMARKFWIVALSLSVFVFAAMSISAVIFGFAERNMRLAVPALGCGLMAWRAFDVLWLRVKGPKPDVPRLDIKF
jgi:hypothetical protein